MYGVLNNHSSEKDYSKKSGKNTFMVNGTSNISSSYWTAELFRELYRKKGNFLEYTNE